MPIIDISGLTPGERDVKGKIRKEIKKYFADKLDIHEDSTTVTFITDETTDRQEHVMARIYSKSFMQMEVSKLRKICDGIIMILEQAGHPYNEVFPVPVLIMYGRSLM